MTAYTLAHPLYLDVQMMVSFLAYLEGGVAFEGEETVKSGESRSKSGKAAGKVKFPSIGAWLGADLSAEGAIDRKLDESSEYKSAKHHTAASLFNYLYSYLMEDDKVSTVSAPDDLVNLQPGQLIQISGRYLGNTLADVLGYFNSLLPYIEKEEEEEREKKDKAKRQKKSGNPALRAAAENLAPNDAAAEGEELEATEVIRIIKIMLGDINSSPVHDLLLATPSGLRAILTVSSQYYSAETAEHLRAGDFVVLGKATRILREDGESINLVRRTAVSVLDEEATRTLVIGAAEAFNISESTANPIISAPAIQILPMAIFV